MESLEALQCLLQESAIPPGPGIAEQLKEYLALLDKWNLRINLTSSTDWRVIGPMFREAIWASKFYPDWAVSHLDIGSGAGFPALLLKVLIPRIELEMVEGRVKKGHFLGTAAHAMGLSRVRVHTMPLSDYLGKCEGGRTWDCISWKALKLKTDDLLRLRERTHPATQLWMFHGQFAALEDGKSMEDCFQIIKNEKIPGRKDSYLSIYQPV